MSPNPAFRCATAARVRADPMTGTAPPARRWLLLEHPGPWPVDAVAGSGIDPTVLEAVRAAAARQQVRILLIRRPGRRDPDATRRWFVTGVDLATITGEWTADADLLAALPAIAAPNPSSLEPPAGPPGPAGSAAAAVSMILVCTHGVHDTCCAIRGRPVAAALAARWPDQVWECSHVGGDRFAPNVVVLPDGFYYGALDPASAVDTVAQHLSGSVPTAALRGMARYPPPVQAAVIAAYSRSGPLGIHEVSVLAVRQEGPHDGHGSETFVDLQVGAERVRVAVLSVRRPEHQLTCRAIRATPATEYRVEALSPLPPPPGRDPSTTTLGS